MKSKAAKKLSSGILAIILLSLCLITSSLALALSVAELRDNTFATGVVDINLNDGLPVFQRTGVEPGMTLEEHFWLRNDSTTSVYYKVYCTDISGEFADVMDVRLYALNLEDDGTETGRSLIFQGKLSRLTKDNVSLSETVLPIGETRHYAIQLYIPSECGNSLQGCASYFNLEAFAVQAKNNPSREY